MRKQPELFNIPTSCLDMTLDWLSNGATSSGPMPEVCETLNEPPCLQLVASANDYSSGARSIIVARLGSSKPSR
jgi:hypothetical protein